MSGSAIRGVSAGDGDAGADGFAGFDTRNRLPVIREKSAGTLTAYAGTGLTLAEELEAQEPRQRIRTYSEAADDELVAALRLIGRFKGGVTVIHGPAGCGGVRLEETLRGGGAPWIITNLDENDSILGADDKLREAVERAGRLWTPEVLFIVTTPVVAINNDDVQSVAAAVSGELGIPVVTVGAAGFRSKSALYGADLVLHALAKSALPQAISARRDSGGTTEAARVSAGGGRGRETDGESEEDSRSGKGSSESGEDKAGSREGQRGQGGEREEGSAKETLPLTLLGLGIPGATLLVQELKRLQVSYNNLIDDFSLSSLAAAAGSAHSLALDPDETRFLAGWLEENCGVKRLPLPAPIGLAASERWLLAAAAAASGDAGRSSPALAGPDAVGGSAASVPDSSGTASSAAPGPGGGASAAAARIAAARREAEAGLARFRLDGAAVFVDLPPAQALGVAALVAELGGRVVGVAVSHADRSHAAALRELHRDAGGPEVYVQQGQPFEKVNLLRRLKPDLYVGLARDAVWTAQAGFPAAAVDSAAIYGFGGALALARLLAYSLRRPGLAQRLGDRESRLYWDGWLARSPHWHIKQEVR